MNESTIAVAVVLATAFALYVVILRPRMLAWGATRDEQSAPLPGDDLEPGASYVTTRAITIDAPPDRIWPWLVQMGQDRAGFYTHNWVERLLQSGIKDVHAIHPEWQTLAVGDLMRTNRDIGGKPMGWPVAVVDPPRALVVRSKTMPLGTYAFVLRPTVEGRTRLLVRDRAVWRRRELPFAALVYEPLHAYMETGLMRGLKERAERAQINSFGSVYLGALLRPRRTFDALVRDDRKVRFGAYGVAIAAALYGAVYFFLAHNGGRPTVLVPWLAIPAEEYYRWNLYMNAPSTVLAWVAAAGFAHLAARALGGRGDYESVLGTLGLSISVAMWSTGLHDVVTTCMGYLGALDQRAYEDAMNDGASGPGVLIRALMLLYMSIFVVLFTKAVGASHGLSVARSSCAGVLGFVVFQGLYFLFNR